MNIFEDIASSNTEFLSNQRLWRLGKARRDSGPEDGFIEECRMIREFIDPVRLAEERDLDGKAWFEYADLTIMQRNERFTRDYVDVFRDLFPTISGTNKESYDPVKPDFVRNDPRTMSALARARQCADSLGLPYRMYIRSAMKDLMHVRGHHHMPRPNQLAGEEAVKLALDKRDSLLDALARRDYFTDGSNPRYRADHYRGDPDQLAALDVLERSVRSQDHGQKLLCQYLQSGHISEHEARARFGDAKVDRALASAGAARFAVNGGVDMPPYRPSCLGYALDVSTSKCAACPARDECERVTALVDQKQVEVTGYVNPRLDRERAGNRKRKRKERFFKSPNGKEQLEATTNWLCSHIPGLRKAIDSGTKRGQAKRKS